MFYAYAKRYKDARIQKAKELDMLAWLIGMYTCSALAAGFGKEKGKPAPKYPDKPIFVEQNDEKLKAKRQEQEMLRSYNNFIAAAQMMGKLSTGAAS